MSPRRKKRKLQKWWTKKMVRAFEKTDYSVFKAPITDGRFNVLISRESAVITTGMI